MTKEKPVPLDKVDKHKKGIKVQRMKWEIKEPWISQEAISFGGGEEQEGFKPSSHLRPNSVLSGIKMSWMQSICICFLYGMSATFFMNTTEFIITITGTQGQGQCLILDFSNSTVFQIQCLIK